MIERDARILITGAGGFIGSRVLEILLERGYTNLACLVRSRSARVAELAARHSSARIDMIHGDLLSPDTCLRAADEAQVVYHLAAGMGRSYAACVLNSVVTTRNLVEAIVKQGTIKRFVNVSSLSVYSNEHIRRGGLLTEDAEIDDQLVERSDPYAYAKVQQDALIASYARDYGLPYVTVRPGFVIGPGKPNIPGRVGNGTFGVFLNLGRDNEMPFTYVDNCADAMVMAGLTPGIDGEAFMIVDDDRPSASEYLRRYKENVGRFVTVPVPYRLYWLLNLSLEKYSKWSQGQLPLTFNRRSAMIYYKGNSYSNAKAKKVLGWSPKVPMDVALDRCFDYIKSTKGNAK